jgi:isocitrate/isopropylmalate dehydrogenase
MDKEYKLQLNKILKVAFEIMNCSKKHCLEKRDKIMNNKETAALFMQYNAEKNTNKKIKLLAKLNEDNNIIYEYDKCVFMNCKNGMKDLMTIFKKHVEEIPKTHPNYKKLHNIVNSLNNLVDNPETIDKKKYIKYIRDMNNLTNSIM